MTDLGSVQFRRARLEDLPRIAQLEKRIWREMAASYSELRRRFFLFPQAFQVALAAPEMAGFCCGFLSDEDAGEADLTAAFPRRHVSGGPYLFLLGLTVNPILRRQGIGGRLVDRELQLAARLGCRKVQLIANRFSRPIFERRGFSATCAVGDVFRLHEDLMPDPVLMEKLLQQVRGVSAAPAQHPTFAGKK